MITGFNTDIDYNGVIYHVQTEDKGLRTPLILSLVYNRGTILASKRSPYNDLLTGELDEKVLAERLQRQHKLICAAIRAGRIEDLKKMNSRTGVIKTQSPVSQPELPPSVEKTKPIQVETKKEVDIISEDTLKPIFLQKESSQFEPIKKPEMELPNPPPVDKSPITQFEEEFFDAPIELSDSDLIFDDTYNFDEIIMVPDEAIEIITAFSKSEDTNSERLFIELANEVTFKGNENKTVSILVGRGRERTGLSGVNIMIKVLSSSFRPLIFHTKTDSNGIAIINLQIPSFSRGRAAILFKATLEGEEVELRRIIQPG